MRREPINKVASSHLLIDGEEFPTPTYKQAISSVVGFFLCVLTTGDSCGSTATRDNHHCSYARAHRDPVCV